MKLLAFGAAAAFVLGGVIPALAEDLKPAKVDNWSGFYAGIHGGHAKANRTGCGDIGFNLLTLELIPAPDPIDSCDAAPDDFAYDYDQAGGLVGIQAGYNWTLAEQFLIGAELSASAGKVDGELNGLFGGVGTWHDLFTATAKAGFIADKALFYGEGGFAMSDASFEGDLGCDFDATHTGPVAGAGVSFALNDQVSLDFKYNHVWLGAQQSSCNSTATLVDPDFVNVPTQLRTDGSMDVVKVGLNFRIGN